MTTSDSSRFLSNVDNLTNTYTFDYSLTSSNPLFAALLNRAASYLAQTRTHALPSDIDGWLAAALTDLNPLTRVEAFFYYIGQNGLSTSTNQSSIEALVQQFDYLVGGTVGPTAPVSTSHPLYQALKNAFLQTTDINIFLTNLTPPLSAAEISTLEENFFVNSFNDFTRTFPFDSSAPFGNYLSNYMKDYATYLTQTAAYDASGRQGNVLQDYETIYNAFVGQLQAIPGSAGQPAMTPPSFSELLTAFLNAETAGNGFFIPSHSLGDWVDLMQNSYSAYLTGAGANYNTSVTTAQTARALVLYRVLGLLITMIGSLQRVAAAQADRLNFLSQWQNAYTSLASQVHFFAYGDGSYIDGQTAQTNYFDNRYREKSNGIVWIWTWSRPDGTKMYASYPSDFAERNINADNFNINDRIWNIQQATEKQTITTTGPDVSGLYSDFPLGTFTQVGEYNGKAVFIRDIDNGLYYYTGETNETGRAIYQGIANGGPESNFSDGGAYERILQPGSAPVSFTNDSGLKAQAAARDTGNQRGQNYVQTLQNFQSIISNAAKALQSNLNQSTDAANQQASFVDAILQKMASIISAIFR